MAPNIIVCVKSVLLETPQKGSGGKIVRSAEACALNPFDRPALELALCLKEKQQGSVTALSMGPPASAGALYEALAMGADRAVLLSDPALAESDTFATSTALAAAVSRLAPFDLVIFGARTADSDTAQVGPQTAVCLGLPLLSLAVQVEPDPGGVRVKRREDGFVEDYEAALPLALTIHPNAVLPRDVGLSGIGRAFDRTGLETWTIQDIGLAPEQTGQRGSHTEVLSMEPAAKKRTCAFLSGALENQAAELIKMLMDAGLV